MYYQLPNGRTISISIDDFLSMSDKELQQLSHGGYDVSDPFSGSTIERPQKKKKTQELDIEQEYDDPTKDPVSRIPDEEHPEFEDLDIEDTEIVD